MRPQIPNSKAVDSAFKSLEKKLSTTQKKINSEAARRMKAGEYEAATNWMQVGSSLADFTKRATDFANEWKRLSKTSKLVAAANQPANLPKRQFTGRSRTPEWRFCIPALKSVLDHGGTATMDQVIGDLGQTMGSKMSEKDRTPSGTNGQPRWHKAVHRAYRQSQKEGWIEPRRDETWKITSAGRSMLSEAETS